MQLIVIGLDECEVASDPSKPGRPPGPAFTWPPYFQRRDSGVEGPWLSSGNG